LNRKTDDLPTAKEPGLRLRSLRKLADLALSDLDRQLRCK